MEKEFDAEYEDHEDSVSSEADVLEEFGRGKRERKPKPSLSDGESTYHSEKVV